MSEPPAVVPQHDSPVFLVPCTDQSAAERLCELLAGLPHAVLETRAIRPGDDPEITVPAWLVRAVYVSDADAQAALEQAEEVLAAIAGQVLPVTAAMVRREAAVSVRRPGGRLHRPRRSKPPARGA